jgi:hypothetical protein
MKDQMTVGSAKTGASLKAGDWTQQMPTAQGERIN